MTSPIPLPRSTPESQGVASPAIRRFIAAAQRSIHHLHSVMLLRHGQVIAEGWWRPYRPDISHMLFSLSKSFTSSAVGLAVHENRLSLTDPVLKHFPEDAPRKISANLAALQVRHLLSMSTGHHQDTTEQVLLSPRPFKTFFELPLAHKPGTFFVYNTAASFMLAAIVQKLTGQTVLDYLTPRLLGPLGITGAKWDSHPNGVNFGGFGMHLTTEDIARFGQLYLQNGQWQGQQLLPAGWVAEATAKHVSNGANPASDWEQGYAYHFWRCRPPGVYRGDGAFGQFCVMMPEQEAVLAITAGLGEMQPVLDLAWEHLLPAFQAAALPPAPSSHKTLVKKLDNLAIDPPPGGPASPLEPSLSGKTWAFTPNPLNLTSLRLDFDTNILTYALRGGMVPSGEFSLPFGRSAWADGVGLLGIELYRTPVPPRALTSGAWTAPDTFTLTICLIETPFLLTLAFRFVEGRVLVKFRANASFGPTELPEIAGEPALIPTNRAPSNSP
jgi:CubicO group peptidase (beta-lactamase class C family)